MPVQRSKQNDRPTERTIDRPTDRSTVAALTVQSGAGTIDLEDGDNADVREAPEAPTGEDPHQQRAVSASHFGSRKIFSIYHVRGLRGGGYVGRPMGLKGLDSSA